MKLKILLFISMLLTMNISVSMAQSELVSAESAIVTGFFLSKNLTGYVNFKECPECKVKRSKIISSVKAYIDYKEVPLSQFVLARKKPEMLVFVRATGELAAMNWRSKQ